MIQILADASGTAGMAGGQAIDLAAVGEALTLEELEAMHRLKTGALIRASVLMAAACCAVFSAANWDALDGYSQDIGLAFQIQDDILDVEGKTEEMGKTRGADAARAKPTYPAYWASRRRKPAHESCSGVLARDSSALARAHAFWHGWRHTSYSAAFEAPLADWASRALEIEAHAPQSPPVGRCNFRGS